MQCMIDGFIARKEQAGYSAISITFKKTLKMNNKTPDSGALIAFEKSSEWTVKPQIEVFSNP